MKFLKLHPSSPSSHQTNLSTCTLQMLSKAHARKVRAEILLQAESHLDPSLRLRRESEGGHSTDSQNQSNSAYRTGHNGHFWNRFPPSVLWLNRITSSSNSLFLCNISAWDFFFLEIFLYFFCVWNDVRLIYFLGGVAVTLRASPPVEAKEAILSSQKEPGM